MRRGRPASDTMYLKERSSPRCFSVKHSTSRSSLVNRSYWRAFIRRTRRSSANRSSSPSIQQVASRCVRKRCKAPGRRGSWRLLFSTSHPLAATHYQHHHQHHYRPSNEEDERHIEFRPCRTELVLHTLA